MSGRLEYKYLVPNRLVDEIRSDLQPYMDLDEFAGKRGEYTVRSVYYDTPRLDCYHEKLDGTGLRRKYRIRGYNRPDENSIVFLEIKRKHANFILKSRAPLRHDELDEFLASRDLARYSEGSPKSVRDQRDAESFLYYYLRHGLRPTVLVVYDREAFHGKFDPSLRLTFDKNLRAATFPSLDMLYDEDCLEYAMARHFIFEVKFFRGALPAWVPALVKRYALPRMALSKYTICLDSQGAPRHFGHVRTGVFSPVRTTM
jgi:hypothetical protein